LKPATKFSSSLQQRKTVRILPAAGRRALLNRHNSSFNCSLHPIRQAVQQTSFGAERGPERQPFGSQISCTLSQDRRG
jgi:hypothetical protein